MRDDIITYTRAVLVDQGIVRHQMRPVLHYAQLIFDVIQDAIAQLEPEQVIKSAYSV